MDRKRAYIAAFGDARSGTEELVDGLVFEELEQRDVPDVDVTCGTSCSCDCTSCTCIVSW